MRPQFTTILVLLLFTVNSAWTQIPIKGDRIIRVLTFNIFHGETMNGDFDLDKIAKVIIDAHPDFVALQEVDFRTNRAKKYDLATELGWRTKLIPLFGRAMYYDDGEYGEGILSDYTLLSSRKVDLPFFGENEPRAAVEIVVKLNDKDTIAFIGTHLDHTDNETDRIAQAKKINEVFKLNSHPIILAGDLNATPESTPINILKEHWSASYVEDKIALTYPSENPVKKIDYVMYYPKNRWKVLKSKAICDTIASDHCAYLVVLELLDE